MKKDNRKLIPVAYLVFVALPLYQAYDIWFNGMQGGYCQGRRRGIFCQWGPDLGAQLFGPNYAYRGLSVLLILVAIALGAFVYWLSKPSKQS
jgi:hypothetical protein